MVESKIALARRHNQDWRDPRTTIRGHGCYAAFQMAGAAISRNLFSAILRLIAELWPSPAAAST